ncbi:MAG TPA: VTT domain-containing protein [Syntrophorhabdaceae bacterium]|nr:VTT domain-containing protein [Syntrophorhabdaceae bacterium]
MKYGKLIAIAVLFLIMVALFFLRRHGYVAPDKIFEFLRLHPILAPFLFIIIFMLLTLFLVPTLPLNLGAGFLWGPVWGTVLTIIGATLGAICSFGLSRYLIKDYCGERFRHAMWLHLKDYISKYNWKVIAFVRIDPVFASGPLNYFFGVTSIAFSTFIWSTALFFIPPAFLFASIGSIFGWVAIQGNASDLIRSTILVSAGATIVCLFLFLARKWARKNNKIDI